MKNVTRNSNRGFLKVVVFAVFATPMILGCGKANERVDFGQETTALANVGQGSMQRVGQLILDSGENHLYSAVADLANGYAYFATTGVDAPSTIIKVALGQGNGLPTRVASLQLPPGEDHINTALIDPANGYAYFGTATSPGKVIKVALGQGNATPTRIGSITLAAGENVLLGAAIDAQNGYAYFGTHTSPAKVVKVKLGIGNALPVRLGALTLQAGESNIRRGLIDSKNGYAYFCTGQGDLPGKFYKVGLGLGDSLPVRVGTLVLPPGEDSLGLASIDTANGYAYLGTYHMDNVTPEKFIKISLGQGNSMSTRVGSLQVPIHHLTVASIDPVNGFAYVGQDLTLPSNVLQISLGNGNALPSLFGAITLRAGSVSYAPGTYPSKADSTPEKAGEVFLQSTVIDTASGYVYFGTDTTPGQVVKIAIPMAH